MLKQYQYVRKEDGNYLIVETVHCGTISNIKHIEYTSNLSQKRIDNEAWCDTSVTDIDFFITHYKDNFYK